MASERTSTYRSQLSDENALLLSILEGTSRATGEEFFRMLVRELAGVLNTFGALVADYLPETGTLCPRAYWLGDQWVEPGPYDIAGTPCEGVIRSGALFQIPDRVIEHYPQNAFLRDYATVSYTGMPFKDADGTIIGHLAVLDSKPVPDEARFMALFRIFGDRAAAEMSRLRAESELREREKQLRGLVDGALDAIIEFDERLEICLANPSARTLFGGGREALVPPSMRAWFSDDSVQLLREAAAGFAAAPGRPQAWIGRRLRGRRPDGTTFEAEATLSQGRRRGRSFHTLILRDTHALREAEQQIHRLERQADVLRDELAALQRRGRIVGRSAPFKAALSKALQVAPTGATVLLLGETGSGKEVFARAIHEASRRASKPLVAVNCAAVPRELVESEFFGHARGAFTGATARRDGRFVRADGGTIFLDEVGELPLDVQGKLLRVLQEGEVDPVGGSHPQKVDVRVVAATNRRLLDDVREGRFREDLYYRLCTFPIEIPPLRERGEDILELAELFAESAATRFGRAPKPIEPACAQRLLAHAWPGNVRELQNIIEHAVITSSDGYLRPAVTPQEPLRRDVANAAGKAAGGTASDTAGETGAILTAEAMRSMHRENMVRALRACDGRIAGPRGAAALLGLNASTLRSQLKALGIEIP